MVRHSEMVGSDPLIVVVDDDVAVRTSLKFSLEIDGFAVRAYASADELIEAGDLGACRCLVIDQNMPRTTGLELVAMLRDRGVRVPTILVSEHLTPLLTRQAAAAGVSAIEKPFFGQGLIQQIRAAIGSMPN